MKILVINSGSSSIKFKLYDMQNKIAICKGLIEQIGSKNSHAKLTVLKTGENFERSGEIENHGAGIDIMNELLFVSHTLKSLDEIDGVGHRVVQGADLFDDAVLIDEKVMKTIEELIPLAPLHNPAHLAGMKETLKVRPDIPNVAVFDTVFHQTMPKSSYMYPLPLEFYEKYKIRRYGAHGTSHNFVARQGAKILGIDFDKFSCITLHLGSGASVAAIKDGKCIDTSMGLTPLEGLMMGTRCGNIDPAIVPFLMKNANLSGEEIDTIMNKKSGLLAISGTNDMREIEAKMDAGDENAKLAFDMFVLRIKKYIGAYIAILGEINAIIFTAGIGENDARIREAVCSGLEIFGIRMDKNKNSVPLGEPRWVGLPETKVRIIIVPTDEELAIAEDTVRVIENLNGVPLK
ncbi:acetate kinase [Campylobacter hyointestinalis subsp. hyointestinalis]|uniref:Acetate kinase n=1 Tax=Campylobacter hyointestinalis subsp. hyointestinalis TaxID=91352 RepID=A0A0S4RRS7_CAMHY|nr:acetate kinase [Campylobacter hyointestinalis]CUU72497.1 acetate kinase [Campylobacter hyointestinalis subsp. hyointestinalis]CUU75217.1 acetate kinase [Campylobacter hyointestinalis subsp. hyointestinalis]CUU75282.1 acetate kinase [Campylobacter hyointestinalis subsp. hyointestinalis]CUU76728.1 acetate kinase [Campylobacter hyointestinalis subsp. hyointestinalis]